METNKTYWFAAKRYGWGWGLPTAWQGWVASAVFLVLIVAGAFFFPPVKATGEFVAYTIGWGVLMVGVCWLKGEPTRWRWGKD